MKKRMTIIGVIGLLVILMSFGVLAQTTTPTCTYTTGGHSTGTGGSTPAVDTSIEDNFFDFNITTNAICADNVTFSIVKPRGIDNRTILVPVVATSNLTWNSFYANLSDDTFIIQATVNVDNRSAPEFNSTCNQNYTVLTVNCVSRSFSLDTSEGFFSPAGLTEEQRAELEGKPFLTSTTILIIIILIIIIIAVVSKNN